jgi:uncharacterized protein
MSDAHREIEEVLHSLRLGAAARRPPPETLTGAAGAGDVALTRAFLDGGADIEERSIGFASPLQAAANAGRRAVVELLLERGADPRQKPEAVFSPLSAAAMHGHLDVVRRLAEAIGDLSGETRAVAHAAARGQLACLDVLLERGAPLGDHPALLDGQPVDEEKARRREAKLAAQGHPLKQLAEALGGRKKKVEEPPPLEGEARREAAARAVERIRAGAMRDRVNELGARRRPLLVLAVETGSPELVDALLAAGARHDVAGDDGTPALYAAASLGLASVVARLLEAGAAADSRAPSRETPLMAAAAFGDLESVRRLLEAGADARARVRGRSAVGYARGLHKKAIRALVEARAATQAGRGDN